MWGRGRIFFIIHSSFFIFMLHRQHPRPEICACFFQGLGAGGALADHLQPVLPRREVGGKLEGDAAAGCGCWKRVDEHTIEVKRIFIAPAFRRQGIASAIIGALERDAACHGYTRAILETARTTGDSAALYHKLGYQEIAYYGSPAGADNCRCFEKKLPPAAGEEG